MAAFAAVSRCCASARLASPGGVFSTISSSALTAPLKWEQSDKSAARREKDYRQQIDNQGNAASASGLCNVQLLCSFKDPLEYNSFCQHKSSRGF